MSLKLVTGPANAAKAAHVLGAFRDRLADEPFLVVPAFRDVEHAQREAAERGAVLGARVVRFAWLFDEIAERCADEPLRTRRASDLQRELIVGEAAGALRHNPERWGGTPVFVYGFDDFTELELDAIESLADKADAEVTVSLPYERGRVAFKAL